MRNHRLNRLALLTQGVALVGIGMSALAACNDPPHVNSPPPERPHINSPPVQPSAAPAPPEHVNGPATPPPTASGSASSAVAPDPVPAHVNAMPKKPPPPPTKP